MQKGGRGGCSTRKAERKIKRRKFSTRLWGCRLPLSIPTYCDRNLCFIGRTRTDLRYKGTAHARSLIRRKVIGTACSLEFECFRACCHPDTLQKYCPCTRLTHGQGSATAFEKVSDEISSCLPRRNGK